MLPLPPSPRLIATYQRHLHARSRTQRMSRAARSRVTSTQCLLRAPDIHELCVPWCLSRRPTLPRIRTRAVSACDAPEPVRHGRTVVLPCRQWSEPSTPPSSRLSLHSSVPSAHSCARYLTTPSSAYGHAQPSPSAIRAPASALASAADVPVSSCVVAPAGAAAHLRLLQALDRFGEWRAQRGAGGIGGGAEARRGAAGSAAVRVRRDGARCLGRRLQPAAGA